MRINHAHRDRRRAFAMPLVMLVSLVAALAIVVLLDRVGMTRLAAQRQLNNYAYHHNQAGIKEFLDWWAGAYRPSPNAPAEDPVLGFDMALPDGAKMMIRLYDAQGSLRKRTSAEDRGPAETLNKAAAIVNQRGLTGAEHLRNRGPGKVSINSAPREVLEALVEAVSNEGNPGAFAQAVIDRRRQGRIEVGMLRELTVTSRLEEVSLHKLEHCLEPECQYWRIEATVQDSLGNILYDQQQGGYALGRIGGALNPRGWVISAWGPLKDMPPRPVRQ